MILIRMRNNCSFTGYFFLGYTSLSKKKYSYLLQLGTRVDLRGKSDI